MTGINKIYQFGANCNPPYIQTDAEYDADAMRTDGWQPGIVRQEFLNKVDRQGNSMSAGLGQFIADNISTSDDIVDTLTPAQISTFMTDAIGNVNITTQPQFDNSQKPATTEFVQRALGSYSSVETIYSSAILPASSVGKMIYAGANSINIALPLLADVPPGSQITINANGFSSIFIDSQSPDLIANGTLGTSLSAVSISGWETITFIKSDTPKWFVTFGDAALNGSSLFSNSKTTNGYMQLPGGLILNWSDGLSNASGVMTATWAKPFPTAVLLGWANEQDPQGWQSNSTTVWGFSLVESSTTHGVARVRNISGTSAPVADPNIYGAIFAIGY
jgi:hypothetical protein